MADWNMMAKLELLEIPEVENTMKVRDRIGNFYRDEDIYDFCRLHGFTRYCLKTQKDALFRCMAKAMHEDDLDYGKIKKAVIDYLVDHRETYQIRIELTHAHEMSIMPTWKLAKAMEAMSGQFVEMGGDRENPWDAYLFRLADTPYRGSLIEVDIMSKIYNCNIYVHHDLRNPPNTFLTPDQSLPGRKEISLLHLHGTDRWDVIFRNHEFIVGCDVRPIVDRRQYPRDDEDTFRARVDILINRHETEVGRLFYINDSTIISPDSTWYGFVSEGRILGTLDSDVILRDFEAEPTGIDYTGVHFFTKNQIPFHRTIDRGYISFAQYGEMLKKPTCCGGHTANNAALSSIAPAPSETAPDLDSVEEIPPAQDHNFNKRTGRIKPEIAKFLEDINKREASSSTAQTRPYGYRDLENCENYFRKLKEEKAAAAAAEAAKVKVEGKLAKTLKDRLAAELADVVKANVEVEIVEGAKSQAILTESEPAKPLNENELEVHDLNNSPIDENPVHEKTQSVENKDEVVENKDEVVENKDEVVENGAEKPTENKEDGPVEAKEDKPVNEHGPTDTTADISLQPEEQPSNVIYNSWADEVEDWIDEGWMGDEM